MSLVANNQLINPGALNLTGRASLLVDKLLEETSCTAGLVLADLASEAVRGLSESLNIYIYIYICIST